MSGDQEKPLQDLPCLQEISEIIAVPPPLGPSPRATAQTRILIYQTLSLFLRDACKTRTPRLQLTMEGYLRSMTSDNVVSAIVQSLDWRKTLLGLSSELGLGNDPNLRNALRTDEERIAAFLVSIFYSESAEDIVLKLEGDSAQCFLDVVQNTLDRGFLMGQEHSLKARRIIRKLSESCDKLPSSLFITGVGGRDVHPTFGGGNGDIYRASYGDQIVALKHMRHFMRGANLRRIRLNVCREALVWKDLQHPHILTFIGIDRETFPSSLCMVSPWMEHGTILEYLTRHGRENVDKLLFEIAQGLQYLHSRNIVHGDLRGANILINQDWSACLADFGLSVISNNTSSMRTSTRAGSLYWMAPELIAPDRFGFKFARTPASDVYAFGCVCIEVYTGRPPFSELSEAAALLKIVNGDRVGRPSGTPAMSDILWRHISAYLGEEPAMRPVSEVVVQHMAWSAQSRNICHVPLLTELRSESQSRNNAPLTSPATSDVQSCPTSTEAIITPEEDMQRLFAECKIGAENATLLSQGLEMVTPEDLDNTLITGFHKKCIDSQKFISTQIPWVSAAADRSRLEIKGRRADQSRGRKCNELDSPTPKTLNIEPPMSMPEEELLAALFAANAELTEALKLYDRKRVAFEPELFQECKIGTGNAMLLNQALALVTPEDLGNTIITRFHKKCTDSQEVISRQIPRVSVAAERSRVAMDPEGYDPDWDRERKHNALRIDSATLASLNGSSELGTLLPTREDELLATMLAANVDLKEALKLYDLKRVAFEPELSRKCKIGLQNAQLLSQALATASPEDLTNRLISDAHKKCVNSQELISTQIPWASAAAERSRVAMTKEGSDLDWETHRNLNTLDSAPLNAQNDNEGASDLGRPMATREEELLAELLAANAELIAALKRYEDLDRVAFERALQRHQARHQ